MEFLRKYKVKIIAVVLTAGVVGGGFALMRSQNTNDEELNNIPPKEQGIENATKSGIVLEKTTYAAIVTEEAIGKFSNEVEKKGEDKKVEDKKVDEAKKFHQQATDLIMIIESQLSDIRNNKAKLEKIINHVSDSYNLALDIENEIDGFIADMESKINNKNKKDLFQYLENMQKQKELINSITNELNSKFKELSSLNKSIDIPLIEQQLLNEKTNLKSIKDISDLKNLKELNKTMDQQLKTLIEAINQNSDLKSMEKKLEQSAKILEDAQKINQNFDTKKEQLEKTTKNSGSSKNRPYVETTTTTTVDERGQVDSGEVKEEQKIKVDSGETQQTTTVTPSEPDHSNETMIEIGSLHENKLKVLVFKKNAMEC